MIFTVLGASGFIGAGLTSRLAALGHDVRAPVRRELPNLRGDLGHVIFAIGLTADFRTRLPETVEAHVCVVNELLRRVRFQSFLYLSSTRVYRGAPATREEQPLCASPADPDDFYNLTKLTGEALCLNHGLPTVRVARLSNVYGLDPSSSNFIPSLIREAVGEGRVVLRSALGSVKDYISLDVAVDRLVDISLGGKSRLYNVASGINTTNAEIVEGINRATGAAIEVAAEAPEISFAPIDIGRLAREFGPRKSSLTADLPGLIEAYRRAMHS